MAATLSNTASVNITVTDVNDNAPRFGQKSYIALVNEALEVGQVITAQDVCSGENGRVMYSISGGDRENQFEIDNHGTIKVKKPLDCEMIASYVWTSRLRIMACPSCHRPS